ncbi:MAG: hypothetical protein FWH01_09630 [Oscillospiraceae bacterium]|nr:hypothetical protein [Oscillospiraceae bacterium]
MKKIARLLLILMVVSTIAYLFASGVLSNPIMYARAENFVNNGRYEEAAVAFEALGEYRDAPEKAVEANNNHIYNQAGSLYDKKDFRAAYNVYMGLGTFKDSAAKLPEIDDAWWAHALALDSLQVCEEYMGLPGAAHAAEAAVEYERLYAAQQEGLAFTAYSEAVDSGTLMM